MSKTVYLSIPYSKIPFEQSFNIANEVAAILMQQGYIVFSPISHSHFVADHLPKEMRVDGDFWLKQDLPWMDICKELCVIEIGEQGLQFIKESNGCQAEIKRAKELNIPIKYFKYE